MGKGYDAGWGGGGGGGGPLYNGLYREVPPKMSNFFRLQVYKRLGILLVEVYKQVKKYVILVCKKAHNDMHFMAVRKGGKHFAFEVYSY